MHKTGIHFYQLTSSSCLSSVIVGAGQEQQMQKIQQDIVVTNVVLMPHLAQFFNAQLSPKNNTLDP